MSETIQCYDYADPAIINPQNQPDQPMHYSLPLPSSTNIHPLFGKQLKGDPHLFDFSSNNPQTLEYDTADFDQFQSLVFKELAQNECDWGIGRYLEERANVLRNYSQMIEEGRIYHLGLDIVVPLGFSLYAPLDAQVHLAGREEGVGNYGGYAVLRHKINNTVFYSFYGHLNSDHLVAEGDKIFAGDEFARIGEREDSGQWFTHTHLQIITKKAADEGRFFQGYIAAKDLPTVEEYFPTPCSLFRY